MPTKSPLSAQLLFRLRTCIPTFRALVWIAALATLTGCKSGGLLARKSAPSIKIGSMPEALATLRESRDPVARWLAIEYLGEPRHVAGNAVKRDEVSEILALAMAPEAEPNSRIHILQSLDQLGSPKRVSAFLGAVKDKDASVRVTACRLLGKSGAAEATEVLDSLFVSDPSLDVRLAAADALGHIPNQQSALALLGGISDPDVAIRYRCRESLRAITGKDYSGDVNAWRQEIQTANFEERADRPRALWLF